MVAIKKKLPQLPDGRIDIATWLQQKNEQHPLPHYEMIEKACYLTETACQGLTTFYGQSYLEQGLTIAEIIFDLKLDAEAIAASIVLNAAQQKHLALTHITEKLSESIAKLVADAIQMDIINNLANTQTRNQVQIDRLRKTLLAMISDIRVVVIKLAERTSLMRSIKHINADERKRLAQDTMDIYAPLANRLGIGQLKWELEDLAFHYINPETYKRIATLLAERRKDREKRIDAILSELRTQLANAHIQAELSGRAKHIYSIYLKMQHKQLNYQSIYDSNAVRILVSELADCYSALSIVHALWEPIPSEFDDYISKPKENGYRSIHTAVIGPDHRHLEIQIRTFSMHEEAEHGVAAHWLYKEKKAHLSGYEAKIAFLRQLFAWHKEVVKENGQNTPLEQPFADNVYVLSPKGDIFDLPLGATPLDFAYQIHTGLGHRCRGAKINGHIVPLSYTLQTGDQVELITTKNGTPSRDWLNKETGYLKTARARAKVAQWFRQQEIAQYIEAGKHTLERELQRAGIHQPNLQKIAAHLNLKDDDALFAAIGHGSIRISHVLQVADAAQKPPEILSSLISNKSEMSRSDLQISGTHHLLTRVAKCCKPIPGDPIIGYITQGRGVAIHHQTCRNIRYLKTATQGRFLDVSWEHKQIGSYFVDLKVEAVQESDLVKEIAGILSNMKIQLINLNSIIGKKNHLIHVTMTVQLTDLNQLEQLSNYIKQLPNVLQVKRIRD